MERLIVLDTETTGFSPAEGHKIVEIGCVEMLDKRVGAEKQWYINPEREIPPEATEIHGITDEQVANCPTFGMIADEFIDFIQDSKLVIHNATFDMRFLNAELNAIERPALDQERAIDTLPMARRRFPGAAASLDALCKRFGIDNSRRTFHGALLDSVLLAEVYVELTGGNQFKLSLDTDGEDEAETVAEAAREEKKTFPVRTWTPSKEEMAAHDAYIAWMKEKSGVALFSPDG